MRKEQDMKTRAIVILSLCCAFVSQVLAESKPRIGVYDSRAIAVAYGASEMRKTHRTPSDVEIDVAQEALDEAKAAGHKMQVAGLKAKLMKLRMRRGRSAFGKAPVDDILDLIRDRLPKIKQTAKVESLVSKWDSAELRQHRSAALIDVTLLIVAEFDPNRKVLQSVWGMQQTDPLSPGRIDQAVKQGI